MTMQIKSVIQRVCDYYHIGKLLEEPIRLHGGLLHYSWMFTTSQNQFVIKKINPQIAAKPQALNNIYLAELIAAKFAANKVAAVSAIFNKEKLFFYNNNGVYLLFPYIPGRMTSLEDVTVKQVKNIAETLAKIHQIKLSGVQVPPVEPFSLTVERFLESIKSLSSTMPDVYALIKLNIEFIKDLIEHAIAANKKLTKNLIISHRDLDPKNVLWKNDSFFIIDWESAGLINQTKDVLSTAVYWSINEAHHVDVSRLRLFFRSYLATGGKLEQADKSAALSSFIGDWLVWLEFNLQRLASNSEAERVLGIAQSKNTLLAITALYGQKDKILT